MTKKVFVAVGLIVATVIIGFALIFYVLPQLRINSLLHIPPDTNLVYETETQWGSNVGIHSVYYLSNANINGLSTWYKDFYPAFTPGNQQHQWLITAKMVDDKVINIGSEGVVLGHESLCKSQDTYSCVTISMVDLTVQRPVNLSISASDFAPIENSPLYNMLNSLPKSGTLIIYRYFVYDS